MLTFSNVYDTILLYYIYFFKNLFRGVDFMKGYVKQISLVIPAEHYESLKRIGDEYALPVSRLIKKGIGLVIEQYMEKGETDKEKTDNDGNDCWNSNSNTPNQ